MKKARTCFTVICFLLLLLFLGTPFYLKAVTHLFTHKMQRSRVQILHNNEKLEAKDDYQMFTPGDMYEYNVFVCSVHLHRRSIFITVNLTTHQTFIAYYRLKCFTFHQFTSFFFRSSSNKYFIAKNKVLSSIVKSHIHKLCAMTIT